VWLPQQRTLKPALRTGSKQFDIAERFSQGFGGLAGSSPDCYLQDAIAIRASYWGQDADGSSSALDSRSS
jgi:hypothetical protein